MELAHDGERRHRVTDAFRLAQVFFDIHGRTLPIRIQGPAGIAHWTYPLPLHIVGWTNVYTVHDLIPLTQNGMSPIHPARHRRLLKAITKVAAGITTVSRASRDEILAEFGSAAPPVVDCGQPVDVRGPLVPLPANLRPRGYFLILGSVETRKNIPAVIAAHEKSGTALPLVVAGPDGWGAGQIVEAMKGRHIVRLPYLPADSIRALTAQARGLIMASLAEGFGLPVAEAMASGTPVITSNRGALAEIAGRAALLVDPTDGDAIAAAVRQLADDDDLWSRLRDAGEERAATFSPERFADRLGQFYGGLLALER